MRLWRLSLSRYKMLYFSVSLLFNFRPLFVYCKIVLGPNCIVCLNLAWLLTLMTVGHALVIGA